MSVVSKDLNRRLSIFDAAFLYCEKSYEPLHLGFCLVYDGHISRDFMLEWLRSRLDYLPRYRQKIVFPPLKLAPPTWEDDPHFALDSHVEEVSLPAPGDEHVLSEVGGRVFALPLGRDQPLWKLILLQSESGGNTVVLWKVHHAMADLVSCVDLLTVMHGPGSNAETGLAPSSLRPPKQPPDSLTQIQDALWDQFAEAKGWLEDQLSPWRQPSAIAGRLERMRHTLLSWGNAFSRPALAVPFNGPLSRNRYFAWIELPFSEFDTIRSVLGGTVNDLILVIIAGGLRRYLKVHGYQTGQKELRILCPVSMRCDNERGTLGNKISKVLVSLPIGIADPMQCLTIVRDSTAQLKNQDQSQGLTDWLTLLQWVPLAWPAIAGQVVTAQPFLNTVLTNAVGPQRSLSLGPRPLASIIPLIPPSANVGLIHAVMSYAGKLVLSVTADPHLVPDAWFYIDCLKASFEELSSRAKRDP